jgi:hypothetical protein
MDKIQEYMHQNVELTTERLADICISRSVDYLPFIEFENICHTNNWLDLLDSCTTVRDILKKYNVEVIQFLGIVSPLFSKDYPYKIEYNFFVDIPDNVYTSLQIVHDINQNVINYGIIDYDIRNCASIDEDAYSLVKSTGPFFVQHGYKNQEIEEIVKRFTFKILKLSKLSK